MTTVKELLDDVTEQEINEQRIISVREAAIRIYASGGNVEITEAWRKAQWLWNNKPDDC